jgi:hypothetical protein
MIDAREPAKGPNRVSLAPAADLHVFVMPCTEFLISDRRARSRQVDRRKAYDDDNGRGMVIDRLESEKIKETKILMDTLGLMRQM